jgi:hypothetical protein
MEILFFILRLAVLAALYAFLAAVLWIVWREFKLVANRSSSTGARPRGRLWVLDCGKTGLVSGEALPLEPPTTLGRSFGNTIVLLDPSVSSKHAVLTYENGCWWVQDAGSTNGTLLNGDAIERKLPLRHNDILTLGQVRLKLEDNNTDALGGEQ